MNLQLKPQNLPAKIGSGIVIGTLLLCLLLFTGSVNVHFDETQLRLSH